MTPQVTADGRRYIVRQIRPDDREHLVAGIGKMSPATRYQRFHNARSEFSPEELNFLVSCDGQNHIAYVAMALNYKNEEGEGVAVTRFYRDPNNSEWGEVAVVVIDAWQNVGIGSVLLATLADHCRRTGVKGWRATIIGDNERAVHLFGKVGTIVLREWEERSLILHVELS